MDRGELLKELHIDRSADGTRRRSRAGWIVLVVLLLALAGGAVWFAFARSAPPTVRVAVARASRAGGETSVLDASGYVTARRQATVSAKITGKVTEVLIEEA